MSNFLAFIDAGISAPGSDSVEDGRDLAKACIKRLEKLENQEQFPPKLLILLTSPAFLGANRAQQLITGVHTEFKEHFKKDIPTIGSSVAAVFYENKIHAEGALLVCLASRIIEAEVAVVTDVSQKIEDAPANIVEALHINSQAAQQTSLLPHRLLLTFLPGTGQSDIEARQLTEKLHNNLWAAVNYQIRIVGGVSSANDPDRVKTSLQFADQAVYKDAIVAALISSGVPLGENLTNGVDWNEEEVLKVQEVSTDGRYIKKLEGSTLNEWMDDKRRFVLFKQWSRSSDRVMAFSDNRSDPRAIQVLREVKKGDYLSPGELTPRVMYKNARKAIERSKESMRIKNPIGCFSMKCTSHYREKEFLELKIEDGIAHLSNEMLKGRPYVGGFFDGEIGMDKTGRSVYGNWGVATIVFGDEHSDSTLMQRGYASMNAHSAALSGTFDLNEALNESVDLICDIGFPGAMISFLLPGYHKTYIIAQKAKGPRFSKIKEITQRDLDGDDVLARIVREKIGDPYFIPDSIKEKDCDRVAIEKSGIISQCVIRLRDPKNNTLGILQVDLGDSRYKTDLYPKEKEMLDSIGAFIAANLSRIFIWNENEIAR
ncbi:MAG TPA: FIST N-terminal domain-containing protein, partial [Blastocatellia bacterium]|nr:FIST N-terminal domain-containing protein [Blastocatellia bacterium]